MRPTPLRLVVTIAAPEAAEAALACGADALAVAADVVPPELAALRARRPDLTIYVALDGADDPALDRVVDQATDGVLLRDARSGRDVAALGARLAVCEAERGLSDGGLAILAAIGHPLGVLDARSFVGASPRLAGLGLDATALAARVGEGGAGEQARDLIRLAAAAAGVPAFALRDSVSEASAPVSPPSAASTRTGSPVRW